MRPPNRSREQGSLRTRSHSFSGLAPPAYEEDETTPLRASSTMAIPLPTYEEATCLDRHPLENQEGSSRSEIIATSPENPPEEEDDGDEPPTIVIHPRQPENPENSAATSSSSSSSSPNSPSPVTETSGSYCFSIKKDKMSLIKLFGFLAVTVIYAVLLYFYAKVIIAFLQPADINDGWTLIFLVAMFISPIIALFYVVNYSEPCIWKSTP